MATRRRALLLALTLLSGCGGSLITTVRPESSGGVLILPVERISQLEPPFAVRLVGHHPRMPVFLHVDRAWDFVALAGRCDAHGCAVEYDEADDLFECECTGAEYRGNGESLGEGQAPPLPTFDVMYREEYVLIDLGRMPGP